MDSVFFPGARSLGAHTSIMQPNASSSYFLALRRQRRIVLSIPLLTLACSPSLSPAQPASSLTVQTVVAKLQSNLDSYDQSIPAFLVDEHIDSIARQFAERGSSAPNHETIAESVFRLSRIPDSTANTTILKESREIKTIDSKPANGRDIDAPAMIFGAFSGGMAMVSEDEQNCMRYQLDPVKPHKPIVVRFTSLPATERPKDCILSEDASGRVTIDPISMQINRIEIRVPHHLLIPINPDGQKGAPTMTRWDVQVIYKPVVLNSHTYWLPTTISSDCSNEDVEWSFTGTYRNYHLLEVHSRIVVPGTTTR